MAIEEGLNVKLVLIPDNEDPDSYVKKTGATSFREFVEANKKDFVIFQLEVMLKEAGNETAKRSSVVNQVAETLSKFYKPEDFTKQQDYIRQCSTILKIDEGGLTNLVNKFKREKITKEASRQTYETAPSPIAWDNKVESDEVSALLIEDEYHERDLLRVLLEYGLLQWDEEKTMADHIFEELQHYAIESPNLDNLLNIYKDYYYKGLQPSSKTLLYYEDEAVRKLVINLTMQKFELSLNWDSKMEGMKINNRDISRQDVEKSLNYFKLRKIKKMFDENQRDFEKAKTYEEQIDLIKIHNVLKEEEQKITRLFGTVIFK
jgi:DNA primase